MVELDKNTTARDTRGVKKKEPTVRTTVLLPESLYATLREIADTEQRSTHRQIIYILERYAAERKRTEPSKEEG